MHDVTTQSHRQGIPAGVIHGVTRHPIPGLLCLVILIGAHFSYFGNGFIWLDHGDIEDGRAIIPLAHWFTAFIKPFAATGFYRPFVTLLHSLDASIWNSNAAGYHCTNVLLHCAAAFAAPLFVGCFFPLARAEQWAITFIFGLHPLSMLPAGGISFRSESLMSLFLFLSIRSYAKARAPSSSNRGPLAKIRTLIALFVSTTSACFSKETAFFYLPAFICVWEITRFARAGRKSGTETAAARDFATIRNAVKALPAAMVATLSLALVFLLRLHAMPRLWRIPSQPLPGLEGIGTRLAAMGNHLVNLLSPLPPPISDAAAIVGLFHVMPVVVLMAIAAMVILAVRQGIGAPFTSMVLLTGIALLPALNLVPLPRFYAPHYAYFAVAPMAGAAILLIRRMRSLIRPTLPSPGSMLLGIWLVIAAVMTVTSGARFQSDLAFFGPETTRDPRFLEGWFYLGNYHLDRGNGDLAWTAYTHALQAHPGYIAFLDRPGTLFNLSAAAVQRNDLAAADSVMLLAAACSPQELQPDIAFNRAYIARRRGEYDTVIALLYGKEVNLRRPEAYLMLAEALSHRGRDFEAREMYRRARGQ